ncbi:WG repeat-containing protein [Clostridium perfringens]|nr:WG repeat-containing protein [Clostridium perfringens]
MIFFQLFFITIILVSSFFGLSTFLFVFFFSLLFTFGNVFTLSLIVIQSSVIISSGILGLIIATIVSLKKAFEEDNLKHLINDICMAAFWLITIFIVIKINKLLILAVILAYILITNRKKLFNLVSNHKLNFFISITVTITIVTIICIVSPSIKNFFKYGIKPTSLKNDVNLVTSIHKSKYGGTLYGLVDNKGKVLAEPVYNNISEIKNDVAILENYNEYSIVNVKTGIIRKLPYDTISPFCNNFIVTKNGLTGLINSNGDIILDCIYDSIKNNYNSAIICKDNKYGVLNTNGELVADIEYDYISEFSNNNNKSVAIFEKNNLQGLMDLSGKIILPPTYDWITDFKDYSETTAVFHNGKVGVINLKGEVVKSFQYFHDKY